MRREEQVHKIHTILINVEAVPGAGHFNYFTIRSLVILSPIFYFCDISGVKYFKCPIDGKFGEKFIKRPALMNAK